MNRAFWFAAGAGASVYAMLRARRAAELFTVDGLRHRWDALGAGARVFREEVGQGRAEAESQLRERLLPASDPTPRLAPGGASGGASGRNGEHPALGRAEDGQSTDTHQEGSR